MKTGFVIKYWPVEAKDGKVYPEGRSSEISREGLTREDSISIREGLDAQDLINGFGINSVEYQSFLRRIESLPWKDQLEFDFGQRIEEGTKQAAE